MATVGIATNPQQNKIQVFTNTGFLTGTGGVFPITTPANKQRRLISYSYNLNNVSIADVITLTAGITGLPSYNLGYIVPIVSTGNQTHIHAIKKINETIISGQNSLHYHPLQDIVLPPLATVNINLGGAFVYNNMFIQIVWEEISI